jgi:hypothetical protein
MFPVDITFDVAFTDDHFEQILRLQKQNLFSSISEDEQAQQGFVFAEHNLQLLKMMAVQLPQVIAVSGGNVIGYNLALPTSMRNEIPRLVPMFDAFDGSQYKGRPLSSYKYVIGGQVCVDKDFRGYGLMSKLYDETRKRVMSEHQFCVTEVSERNVVSLKAHLKMGFQVINTYHDGKEPWQILLWDYETAKNAKMVE